MPSSASGADALGILEGHIADPGMGIGKPPEPERAQHHADEEKAEHRADARAVKQRHDDAGRDQENEKALEPLGVQHGPPTLPQRIIRGPRALSHALWPPT